MSSRRSSEMWNLYLLEGFQSSKRSKIRLRWPMTVLKRVHQLEASHQPTALTGEMFFPVYLKGQFHKMAVFNVNKFNWHFLHVQWANSSHNLWVVWPMFRNGTGSGSVCFWASWILSRILPSKCKKLIKTLNSAVQWLLMTFLSFIF